tara:strand:+ start:416 stop:718 length:303 start_codon:yes stop_codon:yes gene_type:complete
MKTKLKNIILLGRVKKIEKLLNECNENSEYKFKVRRTKEKSHNQSDKGYCITIIGVTHIDFLEIAVVNAINEFWRLNKQMGQVVVTSQHNLKLYFPNWVV